MQLSHVSTHDINAISSSSSSNESARMEERTLHGVGNASSEERLLFIHPTMTEYYTHLTPLITLSIFVAVLLLILNTAIFSTTVVKLREILQKPLLQPSCVLCSFYPIISLAALVTIIAPKTWLICHTVMHLSFTIGAVVFQRLCILYVESEMNYVKETDGTAVAINTPPCCCCCLCLPAIVPSKAKFCVLRYMVWQMPFVQGSIMFVVNVFYYRETELYRNVMLYFMPFIIGSILFGLWSLNITVRMVHAIHENYNLMRKMFCLQLIVLLCKLQYMLLDNVLKNVDMGGPYPINQTIHRQTIINLLILSEMVLVSMLAQNAYKTPVQLVKK